MTAEQYVVKITYQIPPYANSGDTNTVFYVSGKEVYATSSSLIYARKYDTVKNAKAAITQRMRYAYMFKGAKLEIAKVEVTVIEMNIVTEKE
jgi:hypothetical protein